MKNADGRKNILKSILLISCSVSIAVSVVLACGVTSVQAAYTRYVNCLHLGDSRNVKMYKNTEKNRQKYLNH